MAREAPPSFEASAFQCFVRGIRGVWLGAGEYRPTKAGAKLVRFREEAVLAFESSREMPIVICVKSFVP